MNHICNSTVSLILLSVKKDDFNSAVSDKTLDWKLIFCLVFGSVQSLSMKRAFAIFDKGTKAAPRLLISFVLFAGSAQTVNLISGFVRSS